MKTRLREIVEKNILSPLREEEEKNDQENQGSRDSEKESKSKKRKAPPNTISTKGAFGSGGRPTKFAAAARARAEKDPGGLLKDLGVRTASTGDDLARTLGILNQSIHGNSVMGRAYVGARKGSSKSRDGEVISSAIVVTMGELDPKNGVRFLANTLLAATNTGLLALSGGVQFAQSASGEVLVYSI